LLVVAPRGLLCFVFHRQFIINVLIVFCHMYCSILLICRLCAVIRFHEMLKGLGYEMKWEMKGCVSR
jgi:hypothetical protein